MNLALRVAFHIGIMLFVPMYGVALNTIVRVMKRRDALPVMA